MLPAKPHPRWFSSRFKSLLLRVCLTLTTGVDTVPGTLGRDKITGGVTALSSTDTLQASDQIDGGGGRDTLELTLSKDWGGFTPAVGFVKNVETLSLTNAAATPARAFSMSGITGVETINVSGPVNLTGVPSTAIKLNYSGISAASGTPRQISSTFASEAVAGTNDSLAISVNALGTAGAGSADPRAVEFSFSGVENLTISATGSNFLALPLGTATAGVKSLVVDGSGSVRLAGDAAGLATAGVTAALKTIDASKLEGAFVVNLANAAGVTSVKTGAGNDSITATLDAAASDGDLAINASIDGGAGTDVLILNTSGDSRNTGYTMTGVETVRLNSVATALNFSASKVSGLENIEVAATAGNTVASTFTGLGASPIAVKFLANTTGNNNAHTVSVDTTGAVAASVVPASTASASAKGKATDNLTATEATSVTLSVPQFAEFDGGTITAAKASSVTVTGAGDVIAGVLALPVATSLTLNQTDKDEQWTVTVNRGTATASKIKSLSVTSAYESSTASNAGVAITTTDQLVDLETLTVDTKSAFTFGSFTGWDPTGTPAHAAHSLAKISTIALSGSGSNASANIGVNSSNGDKVDIGSATLAYPISITASGLKGGLNLGDIKVGPSQNVTLNIGAVDGVTQVGAIAVATTGGTITVNASGFGDGVGTDNLSLGALSAGTVVVDAEGAANNVTITSITANAVTVKGSTVQGTLNPGTVTAKNSLVYHGTESTANNVTFTVGPSSAAFTADLKGSFLADTYTINSTQASQTSIVVTGALGDGSDTLNITSLASTVTGGQTIDISGITGVSQSTIRGASAANNTLKGGSGKDTIIGGTKADVFTGGDGADVFFIGNLTDTGTVTLSELSTASNVFAASKTISTATLDVIMDFKAGDTLRIDGITTDAAPARVDYATVANNTVAATGTILNGVFSSSANTFQTSSSGTDSLFLYSNSGSTYGVVLVGFATSFEVVTSGTTGLLGLSS